MSQVARNTSAGALGGGLAGAATGAEIGSFGGPVGSAIGAIAGAIVGGVAGGKKARADYENQQEEARRVEKREDSAIRRSVIDSQLAGINVASDTPPTGAGASSVAPVQTPETLSDVVKAGDNLASTMMKRAQLEQQQNLSALDLLFKQYDGIQRDSYNHLLDSQKELDDLLFKFRQNYTTENSTQTELDNKIVDSVEKLNQKLHSATFTDSEIKYWRDNFISKSEDKTETTEKTGVHGDFGGALIGALDNFVQRSNTFTETRPFAETGETAGGVAQNKEENKKGKKQNDKKQRTLKGGISNSSEEKVLDSESFVYERKNGNENRDETHQNSLTDSEINTLVTNYVTEKLKKETSSNKQVYQGYDIGARLEFVKNYNYLFNKRSEFYKRATMTPTEYINPRWNATKELIKFLQH